MAKRIGMLHNNGKAIAMVFIDNNLIFHFQLYSNGYYNDQCGDIGNPYYPVDTIRTRELETGIIILSKKLNHSVLLSH
jgi:hypothetical protein